MITIMVKSLQMLKPSLQWQNPWLSFAGWRQFTHPYTDTFKKPEEHHCLQLLSLVLQISSQIYACSKLEQEIEQVDGVSALFAQDVTPVEVNRVTCRIGGRGGFKNFATKPWSRPNQTKTFKNMPFRHSLAEFRDLILGDCYARDLTDKCQVNISKPRIRASVRNQVANGLVNCIVYSCVLEVMMRNNNISSKRCE